MMKNLVQALMNDRPHEWLAILENELKIRVVHAGDLASLKYDQIESPMHEPIVQQCRGMVVHTVDNRVLAWGYNKFWNLGDAEDMPADSFSGRFAGLLPPKPVDDKTRQMGKMLLEAMGVKVMPLKGR